MAASRAHTIHDRQLQLKRLCVCVCCVDLVNPRRPHSGVIIIQWVTANGRDLAEYPSPVFGLLPWSCAQTTICGFAMQTVKTPNSEYTVSHIGGKTRHMRGHITSVPTNGSPKHAPILHKVPTPVPEGTASKAFTQ